MTAMSIFHFNASYPLLNPSLFVTGKPSNLPGISQTKASSSSSPLRISSFVAWHARTETTCHRFRGRGLFLRTHDKGGFSRRVYLGQHIRCSQNLIRLSMHVDSIILYIPDWNLFRVIKPDKIFSEWKGLFPKGGIDTGHWWDTQMRLTNGVH